MIEPPRSAGPTDTDCALRAQKPQEIGSDFEDVSYEFLLAREHAPPWEGWESLTYVESGRQAIAAVEQHLRGQGHRSIFVPGYLCDSMIQLFVANRWVITPLPVGQELQVEPDAIAQLSHGVLLHAKYFGWTESEQDHAALTTARGQGVVVVSDETHRIFSSPCASADYRVASLRKLLPVPQGGVVCGIPGQGGVLPAEGSAALILRRRAMETKSRALFAGDRPSSVHRTLFDCAEHQLATRTTPTALTIDVRKHLRRLDLVKLRQQRLSNALVLSGALVTHQDLAIVNPPSVRLVPSHLVVRTHKASSLRAHLASRRIYCPIHWPPSRLLPVGAWPRQFLSIPIDHRYKDTHMQRVALEINNYFGVGPSHH